MANKSIKCSTLTHQGNVNQIYAKIYLILIRRLSSRNQTRNSSGEAGKQGLLNTFGGMQLSEDIIEIDVDIHQKSMIRTELLKLLSGEHLRESKSIHRDTCIFSFIMYFSKQTKYGISVSMNQWVEKKNVINIMECCLVIKKEEMMPFGKQVEVYMITVS